MKTMRCSDAALIGIAQMTVDRWRLDPSRSLIELVADLERSPWPGLALTSGQRRSLREMILTVHQTRAPLPPTSVAEIVRTNAARERIPA